jgi:hypothetical protein
MVSAVLDQLKTVQQYNIKKWSVALRANTKLSDFFKNNKENNQSNNYYQSIKQVIRRNNQCNT